MLRVCLCCRTTPHIDQCTVRTGAGISQEELTSLAKPLLESIPGGKAPAAQKSAYVGGDFRCTFTPLPAQDSCRLRPVQPPSTGASSPQAWVRCLQGCNGTQCSQDQRAHPDQSNKDAQQQHGAVQQPVCSLSSAARPARSRPGTSRATGSVCQLTFKLLTAGSLRRATPRT